MKKSLPIIVLSIILLQSCVAYQDTSVSLNDAQNQGRVKVATTYGIQMKFKNIYTKDNIYYGVAKSQEICVDSTQILNVYLKDRKKSNKRTVFLVLAISPFAIILGTFLFWAIIGPTI